MIFVFGSNEAGYHGAGAARYALLHEGAVMHQGWGMAGNSFAIPTKDKMIKTLPLEVVAAYVIRFKAHAWDDLEVDYKVTRIGCGLAGFTDEQIAPLFKGSPHNCLFDTKWHPWLWDGYRYWGTM